MQDCQGFDFVPDAGPTLDSSPFNGPVVAGDLLVAAVTYGWAVDGGPIGISVTDSYGNVFETLDDVYDPNDTQGLRTLYAANAIGGVSGDVFQASFAPGTGWVALYVAEYTGLSDAGTLVAFESAVTLDAGPGMNAFGVGVDVPAAPALVWAFAVDDYTGQPSHGFNAGTGFTPRGGGRGLWGPDDFGNGPVYVGRAEDLVATDGGPVEATWSVDNQSNFLTTVAVFQAVDAGP